MPLRVIPAWLLPMLVALACGGGGGRDAGGEAPPTDLPDAVELPEAAPSDAPDEPEGRDVSPEAVADATFDIAPPFAGVAPFVRVLHPTGRPVVAVPGGRVVLGGLLAGAVDALTIEGAGAPVTVVPQAWWSSDPIDLQLGDNALTVTVRRGDFSASDTIVVTSTPGLDAPVPVLRPDAGFVGDTVRFRVAFALGASAPADLDRLALYRVGQDGLPAGEGDFLGRPRDDGLLAEHGDEIAGDGVFSVRATVSCEADGPLRFRVQVPVTTGDGYLAYSPVAELDCIPRVPREECQDAVAAVNAAAARWEATRAGGEAVARQAVLDLLAGMPDVAESGAGEGSGAWLRMSSGLLGVASLAPEGLRSGPAARRVALLDPVTSSPSGQDEVTALEQALRVRDCPRPVRSGPFHGAEVGPSRLRASTGVGLLALAAHGDLFFEGMSRVARDALGWTHDAPVEALELGAPLSCDALLAGPVACSDRVACPGDAECVITDADGTDLSGVCVDHVQADLRRGRLAVAPGGLAVLPAFLERHVRDPMPDSLAYLGACRSLDAGPLAAAFLAAGARTVVGWTGRPTSDGAIRIGSEVLAGLASGTPIGTAVAATAPDAASPDGARLVVLGDESWSMAGGDLVDGGFDRGDLAPWSVSGDARVVTRFGESQPVAGKFLAALSTGLGYGVQGAVLRQPLCLPPGVRTLSFWWRLYSEEFPEGCGAKHPDAFAARLASDGGVEVPLLTRTINDLCDPSDCQACCRDGACQGLQDAEMSFDQGGVRKTPSWQKVEADVSAFAGRGPVDLVLEARDRGDSAFDTAVLVDSIEIR